MIQRGKCKISAGLFKYWMCFSRNFACNIKGFMGKISYRLGIKHFLNGNSMQQIFKFHIFRFFLFLNVKNTCKKTKKFWFIKLLQRSGHFWRIRTLKKLKKLYAYYNIKKNWKKKWKIQKKFTNKKNENSSFNYCFNV